MPINPWLRPILSDDALTRGLDTGGATIDDFRHPDGVSGAFHSNR